MNWHSLPESASEAQMGAGPDRVNGPEGKKFGWTVSPCLGSDKTQLFAP